MEGEIECTLNRFIEPENSGIRRHQIQLIIRLRLPIQEISDSQIQISLFTTSIFFWVNGWF